MQKRVYRLTFFLLIFVIAGFSQRIAALPDYAEASRQGCLICHFDEDGGDLNDSGLEFAASGYVWPPRGGYRILGPLRKPIRFVIGYFHILSAFIWFGTILYVHIMLKPKYADHGLPKGEVWLGLVSMFTVGISGALLTLSKIRSLDILWQSPWGNVLILKISLYLLLLCSALVVVIIIGPQLKPKVRSPLPSNVKVFDPVTLALFDGQDKRPAYIAYKEQVYDVSSLKLWANGLHMKHLAGTDLTKELARAPHGDEKLAALQIVGSFDNTRKPPQNIFQRTFHFIAYLNLVLVFIVLLILAYWRWGI